MKIKWPALTFFLLLPLYLAAGLQAQSPGSAPNPAAGQPVGEGAKASPSLASEPAAGEAAAAGKSETQETDLSIQQLDQMDSPTHFHKDEWIILNAVKDRTHELFDPATNLLLRKTPMMEERYFANAVPITRLDLFAAPVEYRARLVKLNTQFEVRVKIEAPARSGYTQPLYEILCQDPVTRDFVMVLSPQDVPPTIYTHGKCTVVGFFDKLFRAKPAKGMSEENGNPEVTYILLVGWVRPYEPRPGIAGEPGVVPVAGTAAPAEGGMFGSMGTILIMVVVLVGLYLFIRLRSGGTAGTLFGRSPPLKLPTRNTTISTDPAYSEPIDLTGYGKEPEKKPADQPSDNPEAKPADPNTKN